MSVVFLPCDGVTGRVDKPFRHLRNQHAQYANSARNQERLAEKPAVKRSVRRCHGCHKRRAMLSTTRLCRSCEQTADRSLTDIAALIPFMGSDSEIEAKNLHFYYRYASIDPLCYHSGQLWDKFVPQCCQTESIVRKAVVCVSAGHLDQCNAGVVSQKSVTLYQAAIKSLQTYINEQKRPSLELVMTCCILFHAFEWLRSNHAAAQVHLDSALTMLNSWSISDSTAYEVSGMPVEKRRKPPQDLALRLMVMDMESASTIPGRKIKLHPWVGGSAAVQQPDEIVRHKFFTHEDARETFVRLGHDVWRFIHMNADYRKAPVDEVPLEAYEARVHMKLMLEEWRRASDEFHSQDVLPGSVCKPGQDRDEFGRQVLRQLRVCINDGHYYGMLALLAESLPDGRTTSPFDDNFDGIIAAAEKAFEWRKIYENIRLHRPTKTFAPNSGITEMLLVFAHRTREPARRVRALRLMSGFQQVQSGSTEIKLWTPPGLDTVIEYVLSSTIIYEEPGHPIDPALINRAQSRDAVV